MRFLHRGHAGSELAAWFLSRPRTDDLVDPLVLALPRGGVPVAAEIARALHTDLDVLVVRKVGAPGHPESDVGALVGGEDPVFDAATLALLGLTEDLLGPAVAREREELRRREDLYRGGQDPPPLRGRTVILVDDGLATGVTARAALRHLRGQHPGRLILAVPVGSPDTVQSMRREADDVVCLLRPERFHAVSEWYEDFDQVSDTEVLALLRAPSVRHGLPGLQP